MSVSHPSYLLDFLHGLKAKPKKSLSQNFLIDQNIVRKIVDAAQITADDTLLEIGAGPGALTELLAAKGATLFVVEKDRLFAKALEERITSAQVFEQDVFDFDLTLLPKQAKVISNLPYHLTTPLLTYLLPKHTHFSTLTLMIQKEVALRLLSNPGTKGYGSLTVFTQFYADIVDSFTVKASCFYPKPNVDSMVVTFKLRKPSYGLNEESFFTMTRTAFAQRRKMIRASLKELYGENLLPALEKAQVAPTIRAEELTLEQFICLKSYLP